MSRTGFDEEGILAVDAGKRAERPRGRRDRYLAHPAGRKRGTAQKAGRGVAGRHADSTAAIVKHAVAVPVMIACT